MICTSNADFERVRYLKFSEFQEYQQFTKPAERVKYTFKVAGTSYRTDAIEDMLNEDCDYGESKSYLKENYIDGDRIWKYLPEYRDDVALVDEPENEYDPNAIRVEVGGIHIGYVKKGSTSRVRNLLKKDDVRVKIDIGGGPYKELYEDEDGKIQIERDEIEFYAKLEITVPGELPSATESQAPAGVFNAPTPTARFCRHCGAQLKDSAKFCGNCGASVSGEQQKSVTKEEKPKKQKKEQPPATKAQAWIVFAIALFFLLAACGCKPILLKVLLFAVGAFLMLGAIGMFSNIKNQKK